MFSETFWMLFIDMTINLMLDLHDSLSDANSVTVFARVLSCPQFESEMRLREFELE